MKMQKRTFRIGELAKQLKVEKFVIRFWEKEFNLAPVRSDGGQRFYNEQDLKTFSDIKHLLYEQGFTISGAKKKLPWQKYRTAQTINTTLTPEVPTQITQQLESIQKQLKQFRKLL